MTENQPIVIFEVKLVASSNMQRWELLLLILKGLEIKCGDTASLVIHDDFIAVNNEKIS